MKKIAVFTSNVYEPMSARMQKGIVDAAYREGFKAIFFASFSDSYSSKYYKEYRRYDEGDSVSFDIPDLDDFDGAIRITTYFSPNAEKHLDQILVNANIPVVNIAGSKEQYRNIGCDEHASFAEILKHIVEHHGCRDIYHVAGLQDKDFTHERIKTYKDVLEKHGIQYDSKKIFYGNLWRDCGEPALEYILEHCRRRGKTLPDAIVCANDYTAVGVINACKTRGINVPKDLIVTGYDGVNEGLYGYPTLTTSRQPHYNMGYQAVLTLRKMIDGENVDSDIRIKGDFMLGQSCGCVSNEIENIDDIREILTTLLDHSTSIAQSTTNLMISVSDADTLEECFQAINRNAKTDTGFKEMLLCLAHGWDKRRIIGSGFSKQDEEMMVVAGYRGANDVPFSTFRKKDILPEEMLADPHPYYIFAIHHLQDYMGYLIVSPDIENRDQKAMQSWFVNLGIILESRRIQRDLKESVAKLEYLSNRDTLTELYNRRGLEEFFSGFYSECRKEKTGLAVVMIDMDDLKKINDNYGHEEGDYCLKTISGALKEAVGNDEICARMGGDEFLIIAKNYDRDKAEGLVGLIREKITDKVAVDGKDYKLHISAGIHVVYPDSENDAEESAAFEEMLKSADALMYIEKRNHKRQSGT